MLPFALARATRTVALYMPISLPVSTSALAKSVPCISTITFFAALMIPLRMPALACASMLAFAEDSAPPIMVMDKLLSVPPLPTRAVAPQLALLLNLETTRMSPFLPVTVGDLPLEPIWAVWVAETVDTTLFAAILMLSTERDADRTLASDCAVPSHRISMLMGVSSSSLSGSPASASTSPSPSMPAQALLRATAMAVLTVTLPPKLTEMPFADCLLTALARVLYRFVRLSFRVVIFLPLVVIRSALEVPPA